MTQHRVLDLDLDFFINHIERWQSSSGPRLLENEFHPWAEADVRRFLEQQCGLCRTNPLPGQFVEHHDGAFYWWREMIERGDLAVPFDVVHVDAHSDMGLMDGSAKYIMCELLHLPVDQRAYPKTERGGINAGNYLAFAVACRWARRIQFVVHHEWKNDLEHLHFKGYNLISGTLELKKCDPRVFDGIKAVYAPSKFEPEPEVPFDFELPDEFRNEEPFTHVLLCQSPGFTPASADALIPVIQEYFTPT